MQVTVYADILFLVNWLMDYALLSAVASILKMRTTGLRLCAASVTGACWVCIISVIRMPGWLEMTGSLLLVSSTMIWIALKPKGWRMFCRCIFLLYGVALLGGGAINYLYFYTGLGTYVKQQVLGHDSKRIPVLCIPVCAVSVYVLVRVLRSFISYGKMQGNFYQANLIWGDCTITLNALLDTGNQLREPITGKAVHIVEKKAIASMDPDRSEAMRMLVPFRAVGTETGMLIALRMDQMELIGADGQKITIDRPLIGLYEGKLSAQDEYQLILNTEVENKQGEKL